MSDEGTASYEAPRMRRSTKVALVLLGGVGVLGGAVAWDAWRRARNEEREEDYAALAASTNVEAPVKADRTYTNNEYVPGVGYYHAPFFSFFPFPLNFHDPSRGYFSGGQWKAQPFASEVNASQPNATTVAAAAAVAQQRRREEKRVRSQARSSSTGFFGGSSARRPSNTNYTPRPVAPAPAPRPSVAPAPASGSRSTTASSNSTPASSSKSSVTRGGFGSSSGSHGSSTS